MLGALNKMFALAANYARATDCVIGNREVYWRIPLTKFNTGVEGNEGLEGLANTTADIIFARHMRFYS